MDCIPLISEEADYHSGDYACDEDYVWQCREVSAKGWCNLHLPKSTLGHLAWELVEGEPRPVSFEEMAKQRKKSEYEEPSEAELLSRIHQIPLELGMK